MAVVSKEFHFEAAHILPKHKGKCSRLHGHNYRVVVNLEGDIIPYDVNDSSAGMVIDFDDISSVVRTELNGYWDHQYLNESLGLSTTTAEVLACELWTRIEGSFSDTPFLHINSITLYETDTSGVTVDGRDVARYRIIRQVDTVRHSSGEVSVSVQDYGVATNQSPPEKPQRGSYPGSFRANDPGRGPSSR